MVRHPTSNKRSDVGRHSEHGKTSTLREEPRFGVGFDNPKNELFADSTPCGRKPMRDAHSSEVCTLERTGRVRFNPVAGEVRKVELGGKWMDFWLERVEAETTKARGVFYDKRIFGLAKQTVRTLDCCCKGAHFLDHCVLFQRAVASD